MRRAKGSRLVGALEGKTLQVGNYLVTVERKLGEGGFADIYRVICRQDQRHYALKHFRINGDQEKLEAVKSECIRMKQLKAHAHILKLYAACFAGEPVVTDGFYLLELCQQDLVKCLTNNYHNMSEHNLLKIFYQVAQGIGYMHHLAEPMAHWDLKAENILQTLQGTWVVCDFGSANTIDTVVTPSEIAHMEDLVRRTTTAAYRPPELYDLWSKHRINTKVDIFALGVLLYLMCFSKFPFRADDKLHVISGKYDEMPVHIPRQAAVRKLIHSMLQRNPADRPDINQVITTVHRILYPQQNPMQLPVSAYPRSNAAKAGPAALMMSTLPAQRSMQWQAVNMPPPHSVPARPASSGGGPPLKHTGHQRAPLAAAPPTSNGVDIFASPSQPPTGNPDPFQTAGVTGASAASGSPAQLGLSGPQIQDPFITGDPFSPTTEGHAGAGASNGSGLQPQAAWKDHKHVDDVMVSNGTNDNPFSRGNGDAGEASSAPLPTETSSPVLNGAAAADGADTNAGRLRTLESQTSVFASGPMHTSKPSSYKLVSIEGSEGDELDAIRVERDALKERVAKLEEEVEKWRIQVAEFRSIIDALRTPQAANGRGLGQGHGAPPNEGPQQHIYRGSNPAAAAAVSVLNDTERVVQQQGAALRRCMSVFPVDWTSLGSDTVPML